MKRGEWIIFFLKSLFILRAGEVMHGNFDPFWLAPCFCHAYVWPYPTACGNLVPQPGMQPAPPAVEAQSLHHWTSREVPTLFITVSHELSFSFGTPKLINEDGQGRGRRWKQQRLPSAGVESSSRCWLRRKSKPKDNSEPWEKTRWAGTRPKSSTKGKCFIPWKEGLLLQINKNKLRQLPFTRFIWPPQPSCYRSSCQSTPWDLQGLERHTN